MWFPKVHAWTIFDFFFLNESLPPTIFFDEISNMTTKHFSIERCLSKNSWIKCWSVSREKRKSDWTKISKIFSYQNFFRLNRCRTGKKSWPQDCVSSRGHFTPRLFLLSSSFSEIKSSAKIRIAHKRHTVLYRLSANFLIFDVLDNSFHKDRTLIY